MTKCKHPVKERTYGDREIYVETMTYDFTCDKCRFEGREVYMINFSHVEGPEGGVVACED